VSIYITEVNIGFIFKQLTMNIDIKYND